MIQLGEGLGLDTLRRRHLEADEPMHRLLPGEINPRERPLAKQLEQFEFVERLPLFQSLEPGRLLRIARRHRAVLRGRIVAEKAGEFAGDFREASVVFTSLDVFAGLLA